MEQQAVVALLEERRFDAVRRGLSAMNAVDAAHLLQGLSPEQEAVAFRLLPKDLAVQVFEQMEPEQQARLLEAFTADGARELIEAMSPDDRAALLEEVPAMVARQLLRLLSPDQRKATVALLGYGEGTAGRVMTPDFVDLRGSMTVAQALERVRRLAMAKETIYTAYVISDERHLLGAVSLKDLVLAPTDALVRDIMTPEPKHVFTSTDQEEVARVMRDYDLLAVPVVDREGRLVGIVTWDDVVDIMEEEATEDILRMGGVGVKERADSPLVASVRRRVPWLAFNMVWALAGASVISLFEGTIARLAALAVFMPIVSGQAGNAGIQTATIVVRSIALGELQWGDITHTLLREWALAAVKGALFGGVLGLVAWGWKGSPLLGAVAGGALFLNMFVAATAGVMLPLSLWKLGVDPATVAGVFDTMMTDLMGFLIYLGLATLLITKLT